MPWRHLHLGGNGLKAFTIDHPQHFPALVHLHLFKNKLTHVSKHVFEGRIPLSELYLQENALSKLPDDLTSFKPFRKLFLQKNKLTTLPEMMGKVHVEYCDLRDNQLSVFPESFDVSYQPRFGRLYWKGSGNAISQEEQERTGIWTRG